MGYAITVRYVGPTNYRGSRVIATGPSLTMDGAPVRATVSWDYGAGNPEGCTVCGEPSNTVPLSMAGEHHRYGPRADHNYTPAAEPVPYAGWGDHDANYRRAADAVVAKLRAAGWSVDLAPDDRGALLPDERTTVYVLRYSREG